MTHRKGHEVRNTWPAPLRHGMAALAPGLILRMAVAVTAAGSALLVMPPSSLAQSTDILDVPVLFRITNTNTSQVPCLSDGASYAIHGHLTAPGDSHTTPGPKTVTLGLHDLGEGEWFFRFRTVAGYDYATEMAHQGHASVTISDLGYLPSDQPSGLQSCSGAHADIVHQIVQQLRHGDYVVTGGSPVVFDKVVLAGLSYGAFEAEIEAYSYKDIDGLVVMGYSDFGASSHATTTSLQDGTFCARGGERAEGTSGPPNYFYFNSSEQEFVADAVNQSDTDPAVFAVVGSLRTRAPCGDLSSIPQGIAVDSLRLREVTVPVLLVYGGADRIFPASGEPGQRRLFSGTQDLTSAIVPQAGHDFTLQRSAPTLRAIVLGWLNRHGFVSAGSATGSEAQSGSPSPSTQAGQPIATGTPSTAAATAAAAMVAVLPAVLMAGLLARRRRRNHGKCD